MNLFVRLKNFILDFFEDFLWKKESKNPRLLIESTLRDYSKKQAETRRSLTSLVFYRKQLEAKLDKMTGMITFYNEKVETFALENKDDAALDLMAKLDSLGEEKAFVEEQLGKLNQDISEAQKIENDLKVKMLLAREKMEVLSGRVEALRLRKNLKEGLAQISAGSRKWKIDSNIQKLEKEVFKLELESSDLETVPDLERDYEKWRGEKLRDSRKQRLEELKDKLTQGTVEIKQLDYICT